MFETQHSISYFLRREEQELDMAVHPRSSDARSVHLELARRYRVLIDQLRGEKPTSRAESPRFPLGRGMKNQTIELLPAAE